MTEPDPEEVCAICGWKRKRHEPDVMENPRCPQMKPRFLGVGELARMLEEEKSKCEG